MLVFKMICLTCKKEYEIFKGETFIEFKKRWIDKMRCVSCFNDVFAIRVEYNDKRVTIDNDAHYW